MKITEVPGIPTVGADYRDDKVTKLVSVGAEAMIVIDNISGAVAIHPDTVAFGDTESGWILVPGWQGTAAYRRGVGTVSNLDWSFCLGDVICQAIAKGRIPLYAAEDLPESHHPRTLEQ